MGTHTPTVAQPPTVVFVPPIKGHDLITLSAFSFVPIQVQLVGVNGTVDVTKLWKEFKALHT